MKRFILRIAVMGVLFTAVAAQAQKVAFVDTKYVLEQMPDYQAAQSELDRWSQTWQKEIDDRWAQIKRMREAYNAEAILLTEDMKKSRISEIAKKEEEAREMQKKRFGVNGDLFKKRQELVQPIQDRVYQAVKEVAGTSYTAIFDIGGPGNNVLYANEKMNKSDAVLKKLGIKPGKATNSGNVRDGEEEEQNQENTPEKEKEEGDGGEQQQVPRDGGMQEKPKQ